MDRPEAVPLGLRLARAAKAVSRAFDDALAEAGGSRPTWLVLVSLKGKPVASQRELAEAIGIRGPTLTHHLDVMESAGLVTRRRDPGNRRVHLVELTGPATPCSTASKTPWQRSTSGCATGSRRPTSPRPSCCSTGCAATFPSAPVQQIAGLERPLVKTVTG